MRVHLISNPEPLKEGAEYYSVCGEKIPNAAFPFMWDSDEIPDLSQNLIGLCRYCRASTLKHRYVYGLTSGQEARDQA